VLRVGHASHDRSAFVAEFSTENSKSEIERLLEAGGGPAANAAYLLALGGVRAAFASVVGDDEYGRRARRELAPPFAVVGRPQIRVHGRVTLRQKARRSDLHAFARGGSGGAHA